MEKSNIILILLLICFALYIAITLKFLCKDADKNYVANTKRLEAENDSLKKNNLALDEKCNALELKADSVKEKLVAARQNIVQLKIKQHEKINAIDTLTKDGLFKFFSKFNTKSNTTK